MECTYDYVTFLRIVRIVETKDNNGDIEVYYRDDVSPIGGLKSWYDDEPPPTVEQKSGLYNNIGDNLYYNQGRYTNDLFYINFKKAKLHQIQFPSSYMSKADELSEGITSSTSFLTIPIQLWKCGRLD